jgi:hypothetical protein
MMSEKSSFIRAERIGGHAWQYLTTRSRKGWVVSSFSGGINLLFEGGEAFVSVQTRAVPLHPWAVQVSGHLLQVDEGTPASFAGEEIEIGNTIISLGNAKIEPLCLPRFSNEEAKTALSRLPFLAQLIEEARRTLPPDPFQPQIDAILTRWHESNDPAGLPALIGLGAGATPSGDDVLVGILAGLSILEKVSRKEMQQLVRLRSGIQAGGRSCTPLPSAQMLLAACERSFGEPILEFIEEITLSTTSEDPLLEKIRSVYQLGHHSGHSMLLGLHILLRNRITYHYVY